jgi:hypothetical protein
MAELPGLEEFHRQRKSFFYPKTDCPLPDSFLRKSGALEKPPGLKEEIAAVCLLTLGDEPLEVEPLGEKGTFHSLFRAHLAHRSVIVRVNALSQLHQDFSLFIDPEIMKVLKENHLPYLDVHKVDVSRGDCDFDYEILEEARGRSLRDFDADEAKLRPLLMQLGRFVGRLHRIQTQRFGLVDVRPWVKQAIGEDLTDSVLTAHYAPILGTHETWKEYLTLRLEEHVEKCVEVGAINIFEAGQIIKIMESISNSLTTIQPVLLHGDLGNHNIFTDDHAITAVIDWEDCLCGDPVFDIAFWATFHPVERHGYFLDGYRMEKELPADFGRRFWLYFLRIGLSKTVLRHRFGLTDRPGRPPASRRIQQALEGLSLAA